MNYEALRQFADSWGLLFMLATLVTILAWAYRPSARAAQDDARMIPFRDEEQGQ
ncbi:MAG: cbb3-type cytochrome oxidase subunit 3 [Sandaracinobacteroides sp.]